MEASLAILIGGVVVAGVAVAIWIRATRQKAAPDPLATTAGANRSLTGIRPAGTGASLNAGEALRRFVAYALDDAPREALSRPLEPDHAPVFAAVQKILERIEARPEYIPRRPSLLPKLLATVNDNEATLAEMSRIIAQDPALTGNLLRIANSPVYRANSLPVESIDRAVTLVGVQGIRSIIATALLQPLMATGGGAFSRFRSRSGNTRCTRRWRPRPMRRRSRTPSPSSRSSSGSSMVSRPSSCSASFATSLRPIRT